MRGVCLRDMMLFKMRGVKTDMKKSLKSAWGENEILLQYF